MLGKNIENNIERISRLMDEDYTTLERAFAHLTEEVGEIGSCMRGRKTDEPLENEIVDVINVAIKLFMLTGRPITDLPIIQDQKLSKWERKIEKRRQVRLNVGEE